MLKRKIKAFTETNQALAQWMEDNVREGLTVYAFPRSLHKKIRTNNAWRISTNRSGAALEWWESSPISTRRCDDLSRAGGDSVAPPHCPQLPL